MIGNFVTPLLIPEAPMRKSTFALAVLLLVVIAWLGLPGNSPRAADAKPAVQKWEYQKISWSVTSEGETLNQLGDKGWEMCGVVPGPSYTTLIFKRPKQ
jgi:hypothetical protein